MPLRRALLAGLAALAAGCDSAFDPRGPAPDEVVTIYGTLDSAAAEQAIRVEDVRATPIKTGDATVAGVLVDETDGTRQAGTLRVVSDGAGGTARLLVFSGPIRQGRAYRLDVTRADGARASATTRVPARRVATVEPAAADTTGRLRQGVVFAGAAAAVEARVHYDVIRTASSSAQAGDTLRVTLDALLRTQRLADGVRLSVTLASDRDELLFRLGLGPTNALRVRVLRVTADMAEVSPDGRTPGRAGMTRAYGAFGAVGRSSATFVPDPRLITTAGFRT